MPPRREVLNDTGDRLLRHLDTHRLGLLSEWLKQPAVIAVCRESTPSRG